MLLRILSTLALGTVFLGAADFPDPAVDIPAASVKGKQTAVLAGGCFWCTEVVFEHIAGVTDVVSGYSGGDAATANYQAVSEGRTRHAEAVKVTYDPAKISYGQLLKFFFNIAHDPTQLNRQGPDHGPQYRSAIFVANAAQRRVAEAYIAQLNKAGVFPSPIVTEVNDLKGFYEAEEHHQNFCRRNPKNRYVQINADPKVEKIKKQYPGMVKK